MPQTGSRQDPYTAFRFEVRLDNAAVGGFSECTGLQLETEVQDYAEGGRNGFLCRFPGRTKQTNLVLKRGVVGRDLYDWYEKQVRGLVELKNLTVVVRNVASDADVMEWQFREAFPCKWQGPDLNASQSSVAVEMFELCHQGFERRV